VARQVVKILNVNFNELRDLYHGWAGCLGVNGPAGGVCNKLYLVPGAEVERVTSLLLARRWVVYEFLATYCSSRMDKQATR
jgi:hypothetical protein